MTYTLAKIYLKYTRAAHPTSHQQGVTVRGQTRTWQPISHVRYLSQYVPALSGTVKVQEFDVLWVKANSNDELVEASGAGGEAVCVGGGLTFNLEICYIYRVQGTFYNLQPITHHYLIILESIHICKNTSSKVFKVYFRDTLL
jgi:hypothetical protein